VPQAITKRLALVFWRLWPCTGAMARLVPNASEWDGVPWSVTLSEDIFNVLPMNYNELCSIAEGKRAVQG